MMDGWIKMGPLHLPDDGKVFDFGGGREPIVGADEGDLAAQ